MCKKVMIGALFGLVLVKFMEKCGACCGSDSADATPDA